MTNMELALTALLIITMSALAYIVPAFIHANRMANIYKEAHCRAMQGWQDAITLIKRVEAWRLYRAQEDGDSR